jgi:hypothetical protein
MVKNPSPGDFFIVVSPGKPGSVAKLEEIPDPSGKDLSATPSQRTHVLSTVFICPVFCFF